MQKDFSQQKKLSKLGNGKYNLDMATKVFVNEDLTPMNESIAYNCWKLMQSCLIHACLAGMEYPTLKKMREVG